jgi:hypothetical protein
MDEEMRTKHVDQLMRATRDERTCDDDGWNVPRGPVKVLYESLSGVCLASPVLCEGVLYDELSLVLGKLEKLVRE